MPQTFVLIGGPDCDNGDCRRLKKGQGKTIRNWSCLKDAKPGDEVFIYIRRPNSEIAAMATIKSHPRKGRPLGLKWRYVADIHEIKIISIPISLRELRRLFPYWKWTKFARGNTHVSPQCASRLRKRAARKRSNE